MSFNEDKYVEKKIKETNPILQEFKVFGLNNYKDITLSSSRSVQIIAAENGSGKTTVLNMIYFILSGKINRLLKIDFHSIYIKFHQSEGKTFEKSKLFYRGSNIPQSPIGKYLSKDEIIEALQDFDSEDIGSLQRSALFEKVYVNSPYSREETIEFFMELNKIVNDEYKCNEHYSELELLIKENMKSIKVLYLPTFRRIETEFSQFTLRRRVRFLNRDNEKKSDFDTLIWFGMKDVADTLNNVKSTIRRKTSDSYTRISAKSLEELINEDAKPPEKIHHNDVEFKEKLKLVLSRLGHVEKSSEDKVFELINNGHINEERFKPLRSYLSQLIEIYTVTETQEKSIERFINIINKYWKADALDFDSIPEKEFIFNKSDLSVYIKNKYSAKPLSLNNLSSGEKQIISVFSKITLNANEKFIVLIDEPELSLSMTWQQMFLKDIFSVPSIIQLIAITHSPFIFENILSNNVGPLKIEFKSVG